MQLSLNESEATRKCKDSKIVVKLQNRNVTYQTCLKRKPVIFSIEINGKSSKVVTYIHFGKNKFLMLL